MFKLNKNAENIENYINKVFKFSNEYTIEELLNKYKDIDYTVIKKELINKPIHIVLLKLILEDNTVKYFLYQITDFDEEDDIESIKYHEITNNFNISKIKKDLEQIIILDNKLFWKEAQHGI